MGPAMTGIELVLGAFAGVALGVVITTVRWLIIRRFAAAPSVPPSLDVLEAERRHPMQRNPLTDRRTR
jgi:hypothetical protein